MTVQGTPVRYIDGDERQPSRLAMRVWSKAGEVAAELEELTKSQRWVDELSCTAEQGAPIQQVREFIMSLTHSSWQDHRKLLMEYHEVAERRQVWSM